MRHARTHSLTFLRRARDSLCTRSATRTLVARKLELAVTRRPQSRTPARAANAHPPAASMQGLFAKARRICPRSRVRSLTVTGLRGGDSRAAVGPVASRASPHRPDDAEQRADGQHVAVAIDGRCLLARAFKSSRSLALNAQGGLKQTLTAHDPRVSTHTRKLQLVLTATRGVISSVGSLSSAGQRYAKSLVDFAGEHQEGIVKGPAADEIADVVDRLASIEYLTAETFNDYATAITQARTGARAGYRDRPDHEGFKDIREYEAKLAEKVRAVSCMRCCELHAPSGELHAPSPCSSEDACGLSRLLRRQPH